MTVRPEELASTLLARARAEAQHQAERGAAIQRTLREVVAALRAEHRVDAAWLVGSLAWGGFSRGSDVDVVVRGADPSHIGELAFRIGDAIGAGVDLLRLEQLSPAFQDRVLADGMRLDDA